MTALYDERTSTNDSMKKIITFSALAIPALCGTGTVPANLTKQVAARSERTANDQHAVPKFSEDHYAYIRQSSESSGGYRFDDYSVIEKKDAIKQFASNLIEGMHEIPEEFAKTLDEDFWDILA